MKRDKIGTPEIIDPAHGLTGQIPVAQDQELAHKQFFFGSGRWIPSQDPMLIGEDNFSELKNLRYRDKHIETVLGYSKINTAPLTAYPRGRSGIQLRTPYTVSSRVLVQAMVDNSIAVNLATALNILSDCVLSGLPRIVKANNLYFKVYPTKDSSEIRAVDPVAFKTYDDAILSGTPQLIGFRYMDRIFWMKGYPAASSTANETTDEIQNIFSTASDALVSGIPYVFRILTGGNYYYFKAYRLIQTTAIWQNIYPVPAPGPFEDEILHEDDPDASLGRFALWPNGHVAYCNSMESKIWAGDEMPCQAFISSTAVIGNSITNPKNYSEQIRNTLTSSDQVVVVNSSYRFGLIGSIRPIQGVTFYFSDFNTPGASLSLKEHNGTTWETLTITDGTNGFSENGKVTFDATVNTSRPRYYEGRLLYWYQWELSAGTAKIYHVSLDAPFQSINDLWDGIPRVALSLMVNVSTSVDYTLYVADETSADMSNYPVCADLSGLLSTQSVEVGFEESVCGFLITMFEQAPDRVNLNAATMTVQYWNGQAYTPVTGLVDGTLDSGGTKSLSRTGVVFFDPAVSGSEFPVTELGVEYYKYKITWSADLSGKRDVKTYWQASTAFALNTCILPTTANGYYYKATAVSGTGTSGTKEPTWPETIGATVIDNAGGNQITWTCFSHFVLIDVFQGISAPRNMIGGYKFPAMFQNRAMLCGFVAGKEGNRVDYGMQNSVVVWNGESASFGGGSLYFGGSEELTGFCQVYNRFGASIYIAGVFTKDTETYILLGSDAESYKIYRLSENIGCPAPLTIDTLSLVSKPGGDTDRNIVAWLSYKGPVLCDVAGMSLINKDIECYFDPKDSRCVNVSFIENSRGWFDPDNIEYNLEFPSGAGQEKPNVWLVFDYQRQKWFHKVPGYGDNPYPQAAIRVVDSDGAQYVYGMLESYMVRLENGTMWVNEEVDFDVSTADLVPSGDSWEQFRMRRLKTLAVSTTEAVSLDVTHYADGAAIGSALASHALNGTKRHTRKTQALNKLAWSHQIKFSGETSAESKGVKLIGWGYMGQVEREDL
jgi:hypothetical protein